MGSLKERVEIVDALRGFALFGMLIANLGVFTHNEIDFLEMASTIYSQFILNNFYPMFAILFGLSFYMFMSRPRNTKLIFVRRLVILLILGIMHMVFVWHLDILHAYAITGIFLLFFYKMDLSSLKKWLVVLFILDMLFAAFLSDLLSGLVTTSAPSIISSYNASSYGANLSITIENVPGILYDAVVDIPHHLFLFLIGLYLGKSGVFMETRDRLESVVRVSWWSMGLFVLFYFSRMIVRNYGLADEYLSLPLSNLFNLSLTFFYITLFVVFYHWKKDNYIFDRFRLIGKMTLTSYLTHSVIYLLLFYEINLGLYNELPTMLTPLLAVVIYLAQSEFARIWLNKFGHGPVEKVWRFFTYVGTD
ncbi:DUF418 domain-containing protein [Natranaerobius thermophilus]|uniref:DUF418 domain-containing protein n=1 Tax=Natranaerobius thermophilus (strain ATCC BAA-1301 / DSM 18059 / JW/NM-WN-LF) TaxID=457570 RepID=B2A766_NATTJ|nr:DUF418 domain-containing protein [Natranaerobius thermophilus]ACB84260.1 protein of unknown function DUF405 [Natranaerobius thermophilus JW/NM-WN-LF]